MKFLNVAFVVILYVVNIYGNIQWEISDGIENLKPSSNKALCIILRANGYSENQTSVRLDGVKIGITHENVITYFELTPGIHFVETGDLSLANIYRRDFKAGEVYYIYQTTIVNNINTYSPYNPYIRVHNSYSKMINKNEFHSLFEAKKSALVLYKCNTKDVVKLSNEQLEQFSNLYELQARYNPQLEHEIYKSVVEKVNMFFCDSMLQPIELDTNGHPSLDSVMMQTDKKCSIINGNDWKENQPNIGVKLQRVNNEDVVLFPLKDSPAAQRSIFPYDTILSINSLNVKGLNIDSIYAMLNGDSGSIVSIDIKRGNKKISIRNIKRKKQSYSSVDNPLFIDDRIAYLKINSFNKNVEQELFDVVSELKTNGYKAIIMDLRDNTGGLFNNVIKSAGLFIKKRFVIVKTKSHIKRQNKKYKSDSGDFIYIPIVILVNNETAAGAEIFINALQKYKRANIIGEVTKGDGSIQSLLRINDELSLKITTAYLYGPFDNKLGGKGITPDILCKSETENGIFPYYTYSSILKSEIRDNQLNRAIEVVNNLLLKK